MILGVVISKIGKYKILKGVIHTGYQTVQLSKCGVAYRKRVCRLVLESFVGPCPVGMECCHNDGDRQNNSITNLRWDTRQENIKDRSKHGKTPFGENHSKAKFTEVEILEIKHAYLHDRATITELGKKYHVTPQYIDLIVLGKRWGHVLVDGHSNVHEAGRGRKIKKDDIGIIESKLRIGARQHVLAAEYGVSQATISSIYTNMKKR